MISGKTSAISRRGYLNIWTSKYIMTGLSEVLLSLLYFNFLLTPELRRQTQLLPQIEQIKSGLYEVKVANIKAKHIEKYLVNLKEIYGETIIILKLKH